MAYIDFLGDPAHKDVNIKQVVFSKKDLCTAALTTGFVIAAKEVFSINAPIFLIGFSSLMGTLLMLACKENERNAACRFFGRDAFETKAIDTNPDKRKPSLIDQYSDKVEGIHNEYLLNFKRNAWTLGSFLTVAGYTAATSPFMGDPYGLETELLILPNIVPMIYRLITGLHRYNKILQDEWRIVDKETVKAPEPIGAKARQAIAKMSESIKTPVPAPDF